MWKEYNKIPESIKKTLKPLNDLTGSEWAQKSKSVVLFNGTIAKKRKLHGAAFPLSLAKHFIETYTSVGDTVLDPFVGVGTTLDAAELLGRDSVGFETNKEFAQLAKQGVDDVDRTLGDFYGNVNRNIYNKSCTLLKKYVEKDSIDLILTSPPYSNLLNITIENFASSDYSKNQYKGEGRKLPKPYSKEDKDFGNLSWSNYCRKIKKLMKDLLSIARPGSYNVWVVRDFRDMEEGIPLVNLHGKIIELGTKAGWILSDVIIWDQTSQRKLVKMGGAKSRRFYYNIGHSYIVVFRKNIECERFANNR